MRFKKLIGKLHLWLGLSSGLLVLFLGLTGAMLVFEKEIESFTLNCQYVDVQKSPMLQPSKLKAIAEVALGNGRKALSIDYGPAGRAARVYYYNDVEYFQVFLNPYSGEVLRVRNMHKDFFRIITEGHYNLWLPRKVGGVIVSTATGIFLLMMISGIVLWWPKNKAARKQRFSIKWNARWRRLNYDLHNVVGFYMTWIGIFVALTGLVMGFEWFARTMYWTTSGGKSLPEHHEAPSDTLTPPAARLKDPVDIIWYRGLKQVKEGDMLWVAFPSTPVAPVEYGINHRPGTYYNQDIYHFDQYTLKPVEATGVFASEYKNTSAADRIARMNYDIHVGAIGGLGTKILAFISSLFAASLPLTGFLIWRGRKKKEKQNHSKKAVRMNVQTV